MVLGALFFGLNDNRPAMCAQFYRHLKTTWNIRGSHMRSQSAEFQFSFILKLELINVTKISHIDSLWKKGPRGTRKLSIGRHYSFNMHVSSCNSYLGVQCVAELSSDSSIRIHDETCICKPKVLHQQGQSPARCCFWRWQIKWLVREMNLGPFDVYFCHFDTIYHHL